MGDQILPPAIEARRPWNGGGVIRMEANRPPFIPGNGWQGGQGFLCCYGSLTPIEFKPKGLAKGGERPLGGIGLGGFKGNVMHLARGCASAFPATMTFSDDACPIGLHGQSYPCDIDGKEDALILSG